VAPVRLGHQLSSVPLRPGSSRIFPLVPSRYRSLPHVPSASLSLPHLPLQSLAAAATVKRALRSAAFHDLPQLSTIFRGARKAAHADSALLRVCCAR
jgi:hypothetical protein